MNRIFKLSGFYFMLLLSFGIVSCDDDEVIDDPILPEITAVDPVEGFVGDEIVITGTGFDEVDEVTFGTVPATGFDVTATRISVLVPEGLTEGVQRITVTSPDGADTFDFTVLVAEDEDFVTITSIEPSSAMEGEEVSIVGVNLDMVVTAMLGEMEIEDFVAGEDGTTAVFTVPEGAVSGFITLIDEDGDEVQSPEAFVVEENETLLVLEPLAGPVGTEVTVTGADFSEASEVMLGETMIEEFDIAEDGSSITFTVPQDAVTGVVTVTTPAGDLVSEQGFVVEEEDTTEEVVFEPVVGPVGTEVVISGADFTDASAVMLGDMAIENYVIAEDGSTITFTVPEGAVSGLVTVTTPAGDLVSAQEFVVGEAGEASFSFSPASGPVGTEVTLSGVDFTGADGVTLGGMEVSPFEVAEDGSLTFTVPEGAATGVIYVSTPAGSFTSASEFIVGESFAVYDEGLNVDWEEGMSWDVSESVLASTEQALTGEQSLKIVFSDAFGGYRLIPATPVTLTENARIVLSIYGVEGGGDVKLFMMSEGQAEDTRIEETLDVVEGQWTTFSVPISEFNNPANLTELGIRNIDVADNVIFVDDITIVQ